MTPAPPDRADSLVHHSRVGGKVGAKSAAKKVGAVLRARACRWIDLLLLAPRAGWRLVAGFVALSVIVGLLPVTFIVAMSVLLERLAGVSGGGGERQVMLALAIAVGAFVLQQFVVPFQPAISEVIAGRVDQHCVNRLVTASLRDVPLSGLEDPENLDTLADARAAFERESRTPGEAVAGFLLLVPRYVQLGAAVVLLAVVVSPVAGVIIAGTAVAIRFGVRGTLGRYASMWSALSPRRRKVGYLRDIVTGADAAKEIRILGLLTWLRSRLRSDALDSLRPLWAGSRRLQFWPFVGLAAIGFVGAAVLFILLVDAVDDGRVSVLELGVALQAVLIPMRFGVHFPESDVQTQYGLQSFHALERFERQGGTAVGRPDGAVPPPAPIGTVRFENVGFRYSPNGPWILRHLSLELPAGRSTAIVGLNGAGKTTIVKLLARIYEPDEGRITVSGVDLAELDPEKWQRQLAVIFQDYVRYELTAGENIGLGAPAFMHDSARILAVAERAGAAELLEDLPTGLSTILSRRYPGGRDLSGGQWQRIALARALLAAEAGASVLVLDEPTAQLDVRAEVEFFDRYLASAEGVTSVVISHRFATVRHADHIVVIEHGRVLEHGNHSSLLERGGRYAELFTLQAQRFLSDQKGVAG
jgi:ATP-binding cassette subfamily B protein